MFRNTLFTILDEIYHPFTKGSNLILIYKTMVDSERVFHELKTKVVQEYLQSKDISKACAVSSTVQMLYRKIELQPGITQWIRGKGTQWYGLQWCPTITLSDSLNVNTVKVHVEHKDIRLKHAVRCLMSTVCNSPEELQNLLADDEASNDPENLIALSHLCRKANEERSNELMQRAVAQGSAEALKIQSQRLYFYGQFKEAFQSYGKIPKQPESMYMRGICLIYGRGVQKDIPKGLRLIHQSAMCRFASAFNAIACFYTQENLTQGGQSGASVVSIPKNARFAFSHLLVGAKIGCMESKYNLAVAYFNGIGVQKDEKKALEWYQTANNNAYGSMISLSCLMCIIRLNCVFEELQRPKVKSLGSWKGKLRCNAFFGRGYIKWMLNNSGSDSACTNSGTDESSAL